MMNLSIIFKTIEYLLVPKSPYNCQSISWDVLKNDNLLDILKSRYSSLANDNILNPNLSVSGIGYLSNIIKESFELLRKPINITSSSNTHMNDNTTSSNNMYQSSTSESNDRIPVQ